MQQHIANPPPTTPEKGEEREMITLTVIQPKTICMQQLQPTIITEQQTSPASLFLYTKNQQI